MTAKTEINKKLALCLKDVISTLYNMKLNDALREEIKQAETLLYMAGFRR